MRSALWVELCVAYALIVAALWTLRPAQLWFMGAAYLVIVIAVVRRRHQLGPAGLGRLPLRASLGIVACGAAIALAIVAAGCLAGTLHPLFRAEAPWWYGSLYWVWAAVQQFVLQSFFFRWLEFLLADRTRAALAAAGLFGFAHMPNPVLFPATLFGGLVLALLFARYRSIYPLAAAHAAVGLALAMAIPVDVHHKMRVGRAYLKYRPSTVSTSHNSASGTPAAVQRPLSAAESFCSNTTRRPWMRQPPANTSRTASL